MAKTLQHRRDTTTNLGSEAGAIGEFFMDTTKNTLVVMDGSTTGGHPLATESYVDTSINNLIGGAPGTLDTLNELAAALNDDANVYTTLTNSIATKQDTLVSGTTIKTVNGTSLLGSGNITISGGSSTTYSLEAQLLAGGARLTLVGSDASTDEIQFRSGTGTSVTRTDASTITISAAYNDIGSDVLPNIDGIYDLGSDTTQWYDLFVSNGVTIGGSSLTGNSTGLVTDTMLIGDLLLTTNTITPDASTALQYNGDQGVVDIIGNLDVSAGDWLLPAIVDNFSETTTVKANAAGLTGESFWISGNSVARSFYFESQAARTAFIDNFLKAGAEITFNFSYPGGDWIANIASDFDADSDLSTTETGSPDPLQPYGVIVGNSKWSWDTVAGEGEPTNGLYTMTYTTSATYTTSSGVPLTTGTEGAIRYNKIEGALQVYLSTGWTNLAVVTT